MATVSVTMGIVAISGADDIVGDADGVVPVEAKDLDFGTVCVGSTSTKPALLAVRRSETGAKFPNNAVVRVAATAASPLQVAMTDAEIRLPEGNWAKATYGTMSTDTAEVSVTLAPTTAGTITGS